MDDASLSCGIVNANADPLVGSHLNVTWGSMKLNQPICLIATKCLNTRYWISTSSIYTSYKKAYHFLCKIMMIIIKMRVVLMRALSSSSLPPVHHPAFHTFITGRYLESPLNLTCVSLGCQTKPRPGKKKQTLQVQEEHENSTEKSTSWFQRVQLISFWSEKNISFYFYDSFSPLLFITFLLLLHTIYTCETDRENI